MIVDSVPQKKRLRTFAFFIAMLILYLGLCQLMTFTLGTSNIILGILFFVLGIICIGLSLGTFVLFIEFMETFKLFARSKIPSIILIILSAIICGTFAVYSFQVYEAESDQYRLANPTANIVGVDTDPNAKVTCNNQEMSLAEVCEHVFTINGSSSTTKYTYDEQKKYQKQQRIDKDREDKIQKMPVKPQTPLDAPLLRMLVLASVAFGTLVIVGVILLRQM
ncbi:hypothetical protein KDA_45210 [Dictyobacter alpinus]|uniref:Uncharacterized protein n=1 Tax=Dictyobacter alpinus TaxID=2014873 RepID=A0A402BCM5_9CHLR|nr:hypothetical protein [Dictyobacter alpinus]GCE29037.1 hypothetical protein KDA_45210 [Dictyobacter alpinus]